jgi:hypothetical protein
VERLSGQVKGTDDARTIVRKKTERDELGVWERVNRGRLYKGTLVAITG